MDCEPNMSAHETTSDVSNLQSQHDEKEATGKTASNTVNTEELLASLSMLELAAAEVSDDSDSYAEDDADGVSTSALPELSEPMRVIGKDQHLSQLFNRVQSLLKGEMPKNRRGNSFHSVRKRWMIPD